MRRAAVIAALLCSGAAQAETVAVRGGEHADFTRLVLPVQDGAAWEFVPTPGGFELGLPDSIAFDLDRAFDRIPRDRIQALRPLGDGRLSLSATCDCHAEADLIRGVGLVIDVIDGPAPPGGLAPGPVVEAPKLPLLIERQPTLPPFGPLAGLGPDSSSTTPSSDQAQAQRIAQTEARILESLAAAATRGLLDVAPAAEIQPPPASPASDAIEDGQPLPEEAPPQSGPSRALAEPSSPEPRPGLAFRTGASIDSRAQGPLGATGTPCLPKEDFDLAAWGGGERFDVEITARLAQLSDARDRLDAEAVEALARTYLAFGFGREAMTALALDGRSSRERDGLRLLARLIDGEAVPSGTLEDQAGCLGPVALWRALARETLRGTDERERAAMMVALRALPPSVRGLVALRLAGLFLDDGDARGAAAAAALAKGTGSEDPLTEVEIVKETEGPAPALAELESLAESHPRMTPEGLVELIDLRIADGQLVSEDTLELVRALRFEHGGDGARALLLAEARALAAASHYEEALILLEEERSLHPGDDIEAAMGATITALSDGLDDAAFLELALGGLPADLPPPSRDLVARRLAALGFPDEAWALRAAVPHRAALRAPDVEDRPPLLEAPPAADIRDPVAAMVPEPGHDPAKDLPDDWRRPPPQADVLPAPPEVGHSAEPLLVAAAPDPVVPPVPEEVPRPSDPAIAPTPAAILDAPATLAQRRTLLEDAGAARARAAALLSEAVAE